VSTDESIKPRFNWTSFYTTTKACPAYLSYVIDDSDEIIAETYLDTPDGLKEINPYGGTN
jgi:hypothetical protein